MNLSLEDFLKKVSGNESDIIEYTNDEALKAVENDGYALQYVKEQTEAIALKAVEKNGYALQYVKEQTEAIALKAVEKNGDALRYVNKSIFRIKAHMEITLKDIELKFGCSVKIVKEEN